MIYIPVIIASLLVIPAFRIIGQSWAKATLSWAAIIISIAACYGLAILVHFVKP